MINKEKRNSLIGNLKGDMAAIYLLMKDKQTDVLTKILAFLIVAYFISPIDLIPDFTPFLGYLDDVILLPLLVTMLLKRINAEKFSEYKKQAMDMTIQQQWYYALPVIFVWLAIIVAIIVKIWSKKNG